MGSSSNAAFAGGAAARSERRRYATMLGAWGLVAALPLASVLFGGRVLYYRDVSVTYFPDLVFLERSLRQGIWPLWHPGADAGAPFLVAYPVHLALVWLAGASRTLALSPWLHLVVAMAGAGWLSRRLGTGWWGSWLSGAVYGLSGWMLGSLLYPVFLAAAWAPAVVAATLSALAAPSGARAAVLAVLLAVQCSTFGAEVLPQTVFAALVLAPRPTRRGLLTLAGAAALALVLAAPALAGAAWLLQGTVRGAGFSPRVSLEFSAPLPVLLEAVLPRFLGDPHTFSNVGFWGQAFFPEGNPFFLSLYLGPLVLLLAARAGVRQWRPWLLVAVGVLLSLGAYGPLAPFLAVAMARLRVPAKFFLLATLGVSLLAGRGLERARAAPGRAGLLVAGGLFTAAALARWAPGGLASTLALLVPQANGPLARHVIASCWPVELALSGLAVFGAGIVLQRGGSPALAAGLLAVLDLVRVGSPLNLGAEGSFYELRPQVAEMVRSVASEGRYRWFSYGVALSPPLRWNPEIARRNEDAWLFYFDRQALLPRTGVLDGIESAYDVDRMGLAPAGATLDVAEAGPHMFPAQHDRLRAANVRWVLSFVGLPASLATRRAQVSFAEVANPLSLYELRDPLPRAFYLEGSGTEPEGSGTEAAMARTAPRPEVVYQSPDPHTVRLTCDTPPGWVAILDGFHRDWIGEPGAEVRPLELAGRRYRAVRTAGGRRVITLRFAPPWRRPALALAAAGWALVGLLIVSGCVRFHRTLPAAAC